MKSSLTKLFICGALLGAVCFLLIYGVRILDPAYDDWLLLGDMDLKQHYIGFCHFRMSAWQFPIGLIETLSYPNKMSVIYTDSIPILAVIFKFFAYVLPQKFQYFGFAGLLSFMLMGGFSSLVLYRFLNQAFYSLLYSLCFIISYPVIQRMYYHTALASQWILLAAMALWLYQEKLSFSKRMVLWSTMGFLCVSIHSYFLPMTGLILLCAFSDEILTAKEAAFTDQSRQDLVRKGVKHGLLELAGFCLTALFALFVYGGFYGGSSAVGEGLGTFTSNLNTFINPLDDGMLYGSLPLYNGFQYEGFGYLGGGILLLLITGLIALSALWPGERIKRKKASDQEAHKDCFLVFRTKYRPLIAGALFILTCMLSMLPMVTLNEWKLFGVPYPDPVRKLLGIFRSNGRFIWTAVYLAMLFAITLCFRLFYYAGRSGRDPGEAEKETAGKKNGGRILYCLLTFLAIGLQLYDISGMLAGKHENFANPRTYDCFWENEEKLSESKSPEGRTLGSVLSSRSFKGFVFLYNENDIIMDTAYYGYLNGMWQNNYYYARDINAAIDRNIEEWKLTLLNGHVRDDILYLFKEKDTALELGGELMIFPLQDHYVGIAKQAGAMKE